MESPVQIGFGTQAEKREGQHPPPPSKRVKLNKVAEVVLVLAAMGKMRSGGVEPTDSELGLMEAAAEGLARVCEGFAPTEVFPKDVFGSVIDDLGLNGLKDLKKPGDLPPKLSIYEKMLASKRKMEQAENFSLQSSTKSYQHLQWTFSSAEEHCAPPQLSQMAKSYHTPVSSGSHSSVGASWNSTYLSYQLPTSELKPIVSAALPRASSRQMKLDPITALPAQGNQVPENEALKVESNVRHGLSPQMTTSMETKVPTTTVLPPRGTKLVHASLANHHSEISKIIQKILQPKVPEHRAWVLPSRGFMSKALTCQMCMETVTEINGVRICDACEKGYHLKCLKSNQIGDATEVCHCRKCLSLNNGISLASKYGRVRRSMNPSKISSSNSAAVEYTTHNLGASHDVCQPAKSANGSTSTQNCPTAASTLSNQVSRSEPKDATKVQDNNNVAIKVEVDGKVSSGSSLNILMKTSASACFTGNSPVDCICDEKTVVLKLNAQAKLANGSSNHSVGETVKPDTSLTHHSQSSSDDLHVVNWVGDPVEVSKEKIHYVSCSINGVEYRVMDHVLIRFVIGKLVPSKLQAMWEDKATRKKWITVNRHYFPGDLPETVGCPCGMEINEICESSSVNTLPANLIESSCQVLPAKMYAEETERRRNSGTHPKLPPLYMCRWIYDEAKGLFRDVSS